MKKERAFILSDWFAVRFVFDTDGFWTLSNEGRRIYAPIALMHSKKIDHPTVQRNISITMIWVCISFLTVGKVKELP